MSHAVVQIYQLHQLPQPAHSPLYKCQRHPTCRSYNITIPNILNVSPASSPSSSSDVDDNGYCSPNPELTSFVSIDGDYDDEETQNVTVVSFGLGVATAPPLDDDYIVTCDPLTTSVKGGVIGERSSSTSYNDNEGVVGTPTEEEMCIICYDKIDKIHGNFYSNFCDTCKYTVHISCIEEYMIRKLKDDVQTHQTRFVGIKCLMCSKVVERAELTQEEFDEINNDQINNSDRFDNRITAEQRRDIRLHQHALRVMERQIRHDRRNGNKRFVCHVCFILCLIICAGGVLAAVITKTT
jgi:hypothetical protein